MQISSSLTNPLLNVSGTARAQSSSNDGTTQQSASAASGDTSSSASASAVTSSNGLSLSSSLLAILQSDDGSDLSSSDASDLSSSQQLLSNVGFHWTAPSELPSGAQGAVPGIKDLTASQVSSIEDQLGVKAVYGLNADNQVDTRTFALYDTTTGKALDPNDKRDQQFRTLANKIGTPNQGNGSSGSGESNIWDTVIALMTDSYDASEVAAAKQWLAEQSSSSGDTSITA